VALEGAARGHRNLKAPPLFKQPKRVFITYELPRIAIGKVQKSELRDRYANAFVG